MPAAPYSLTSEVSTLTAVIVPADGIFSAVFTLAATSRVSVYVASPTVYSATISFVPPDVRGVFTSLPSAYEITNPFDA